MKAYKTYPVALLLIFAALMCQAQTPQGSISGKLQDAATKSNLPFATIAIYKALDTVLVTYRLSGPDGNFKVPGLSTGARYRMIISLSGYSVYRHEFELLPISPQLNMQTILLTINPQLLEEVLVTAERPPVIVKKDTIEFNAASFKTLPNALVEDLLKKLPGVDVEPGGNITVNGRQVSRILVDGKDFFGGDIKIASRNLPANIIDKVQVTDDKEQLDRDFNLNSANVDQVINLKLKKSIKRGLFGKVYAGAGTDERYEAGGIFNLFTDTLQLSILGYTNNLNKAGFAVGDMQRIGGFTRSGANSISRNSDGGYSINDISFGGTGQGIQRSTGTGANLNHELAKNVSLNLQYFYGNLNSRLRQTVNTQQFLLDTVVNILQEIVQDRVDIGHNIGGALKWKINPSSVLNIRPSLSLRKTKAERDLATVTSNNFQSLLNRSINNLQGNNGNNIYFQDINYSHRFRKQGRMIYISNVISAGSIDNDDYINAHTMYYNGQPGNADLRQLRDRDIGNFRITNLVNYNEPLGKSTDLKLSHSYELLKDDDELQTYNRSPGNPEYNEYAFDLSNGLNRTIRRNSITTGLSFKVKAVTVSPGIKWQGLGIENDFLKIAPVRQQYFFALPSLAMAWKEFYFNYASGVLEPRSTDLQPVPDNTNPLFLQFGNPYLEPTLSQNFYLMYNKYNRKRGLNYNFYLNGRIDDNAVIYQRTIDSKGVQSSTPLNVDGAQSFGASISISKQYKFNQGRILIVRMGLNPNYARRPLIFNGFRSLQKSWTASPSLSYTLNIKDVVELNQRYSIGFYKSKYNNPAFPDLQVVTHYSDLEMVVRAPRRWVWENSFNYFYNPEAGANIHKSNFRWNAAINFLFLKDNAGHLKLSVYDLLNQNVSVTRLVRENFIQESQTTVLRRYFLLSFTYNIKNFSPGKVGGKEKLLLF